MSYIIKSEEKREKLILIEIILAIGLMIGFTFGMFAAGGQVIVFNTALTGCIIVMIFGLWHLYLTEWSVPKGQKDGTPQRNVETTEEAGE